MNHSLHKSCLINVLNFNTKTHLGLVLILLISLTATLFASYILTYESAKTQILDMGGEMYTRVTKDVIAFIEMMDIRVKRGELTLDEAQEIVRTYVNGPKNLDGSRDLSKSKMATEYNMFVWASTYKHERGTLTMHPFKLEGINTFNYQVRGQYPMRDFWSKLINTGHVVRHEWKNPGEPVYMYLSYQQYFEPWDWIVGCGGREELIYESRLEGLTKKFLIVGAIFLLISLIHIYSFSQVEMARRQKEEETKELNRELEQRVTERTAQLEATNRELDSFAYSVSHDLRAPLRAIDGFSEALLDDYGNKLNGEGETYLHYLREGAHEMNNLIDGLLSLSRSTRGELVLERVDLSGLVNAVAEDLRKMEPERRVTVLVASGVEANADPQLLRVVMENLLGNAWKYTSKTADACIEFGVEEKKGKTVFFVRDNGAGFDMTYAEDLFRPFRRLHNANEFPGTGIGLATVERIIRRHKGSIWAQAALGQGATFYFTLDESTSTY